MLSENVKENVSGWGLAAVCFVSLLFLPNWSWGQADQTAHSANPPVAEPAIAAKETSKSTEPKKGESSVADAPANPYSVTLSNGMTVEVVGILRNPRNRKQWWAPDGTLIPAPADDIKFESPSPEGAAPADEVALYVTTTGTDGERNGPWATRHGFVPLPKAHKTWASLYRDFEGIGSAQILIYPLEVDRLTYTFSVAAGPWERIATFDGKSVKTELPDTRIECASPKQVDNRVCFEVHHNLNSVNYHLRMRARLKDGKIQNATFEPHDLRRTPSTGFVEAYGIETDHVEEWILERSPWVHGEVPNIALMPKEAILPEAPHHDKPSDLFLGFEIKRKKDIVEGEGTISEGWAVNFETGKVQPVDCKYAAEKEGSEAISALRQWATTTGNDVVFSPNDPRPNLIGLDIVLMRVDSGQWFDGLYRPKLARNILLQNSIQGFPTVTSVPEAVPATFIFRTREGSFGVLQITEVDDSTLRLRYRLRPVENKEMGARFLRIDAADDPQHNEAKRNNEDGRLKVRLHADKQHWRADADAVLKLDLTLAANAVDIQTAEPTYGWLLEVDGATWFIADGPWQQTEFVQLKPGQTRKNHLILQFQRGDDGIELRRLTADGKVSTLSAVPIDHPDSGRRHPGRQLELPPGEHTLRIGHPLMLLSKQTSRMAARVWSNPLTLTIAANDQAAAAKGERPEPQNQGSVGVDEGAPATEHQGIQPREGMAETAWHVDAAPEHRLVHGWMSIRSDGGTLVVREHAGGGVNHDGLRDPLDLRISCTHEDDKLQLTITSSWRGKRFFEVSPATSIPRDAEIRIRKQPKFAGLTETYQVLWRADVFEKNDVTQSVVYVARLVPLNDDASGFDKDEASKALDVFAAAAKRRVFVRLVVGPEHLTFEGGEITWDGLPEALTRISDRSSAVLEVAVSTGEISVAKQRELISRAAAEAKKAGLDHTSFVGVRPLGSKGSKSTSIDEGKGTAAPTTPVQKPKHFVRIVVGQDSVTFEGQKTTWEELPQLLQKIPNRPEAVLEVAITSEDVSIRELNSIRGRVSALSRMYGFQYDSYIGVHPLGSEGKATSERPSQPKPDKGRGTPVDPPQGEPREGVSVRLRADKIQWRTDENPAFKADVHNDSKEDLHVAQAQQLGELEVNGIWYRWVGHVNVKSSWFPPSRHYHDIPIELAENWQTKEGQPLKLAPGENTPYKVDMRLQHPEGQLLNLVPGKYTIRFAILAERTTNETPIKTISNPVEIEVVSREHGVAAPLSGGLGDEAKDNRSTTVLAPEDYLTFLQEQFKEHASYSPGLDGPSVRAVREEDVPKLVELFDSKKKCSATVMAGSAVHSPDGSTVGHEAAVLVDSLRTGKTYPIANTSTEHPIDRMALLKWWSDQPKEPTSHSRFEPSAASNPPPRRANNNSVDINVAVGEHNEAPAAQQGSADKSDVTFSPVVEVTLPTERGSKRYLTLDDGELHESLPTRRQAVSVGQDKDIAGPNPDRKLYVRLHDIHSIPVDQEEGTRLWEKRTAEEHGRIAAGFFGELPSERNFIYRVRQEHLPLTINMTYLGVLQVTEIIDGELPSLRVRYRLMQQAE